MQRAPHIGLNSWAAEDGPKLRRCDHPDCQDEGLYRAPKGRDRLREYYWFCLAHVRDYNSRWDYYAGMSEREIEDFRRRDTIWERPSWPLGARMSQRLRLDAGKWRDFFGVFGEDRSEETGPEQRAPKRGSPEDQALAVFELSGPVTLERVKSRYKELVKRHHPDKNGGDKAAEERLKIINQAYTTLKSSISA
ncbi:MAG TPA: J domain-containing protein [Alphaproteobacteria bacterium]|nr:J domain-containing protein [Alphaproteobacteria bacterium]